MSLRPFFTFYGGKWRAAPKYPAPRHDTIIEPFAGSAGYSLRYPERRVILVERDPVIAATWRYLLRVSPEEILALPDLEVGQTVDDLSAMLEVKWLVGWWCGKGTASPGKSLTAWGRDTRYRSQFWGQDVRERIASQVGRIRHWTLIEGDYANAPDMPATWFIDPPYQKAGKHYRYGSKTLDFAALGAWCRTRRGQVTVCENVGADWLPFRHFLDIKASEAKHGGKVSREAIWMNEVPVGWGVQRELFG